MGKGKIFLGKRKVIACLLTVAFLVGEVLQPVSLLRAEESAEETEDTVSGIEISVVTVEGNKGSASDINLETAFKYLKTEAGMSIQLSKIKELVITGGQIREEDWTYIFKNYTKFSSLTDFGTEGTGRGEGVIPATNFPQYFPRSVQRVEIPDGITSIGNNAFYGCSSLTEVTIPDSVKEIGGGAFYSCKKLKRIKIPDCVTEIGIGTFGGCVELEEMILPPNLKTIKARAFTKCSGLKEIVFPKSLESISMDGSKDSDGAFSYCTSLTKVVIPGNVKEIGIGTFSDCDKLEEVVIEEGVETIETEAFARTAIKNMVIPGSVKKIVRNVFYDCSNLEKVVALDGITSVESGACINCSSLTEVTIPGSVKEIGGSAFGACGNLVKVNLSEGLEIIGSNAFSSCKKLEQITIPDSVTEIGSRAFQYCEELKEVILPQNLTTIGDSAFSDCESLLSITIPDGVTAIGNSAFYYCRGLKKVVLPKSLDSIKSSTFSWCSNLTEVTVPASVTSISTYAFQYCSKLSVLNIYVKNEEEVTAIGTTGYSSTGPFADCLDSRKIYFYTEGGLPLSESTVPKYSDVVTVYEAVEDDDKTDDCWWGWQLKETYSVVSHLTNLTGSNGTAAWRDIDGDYRTTLIPAASTDGMIYTLPKEVMVKIGDHIVSSGEDYTYDPADGSLLIKASSIDGNIEIEAAADGLAQKYKITVKTTGDGRVRMETSDSAQTTDKNDTQEVTVSVRDGLLLSFMPEEGATLSSLFVDGEKKEAVDNKYILSDIREAHSIQVVFMEKAVVTPSPSPVPTASPVPDPTPTPTLTPTPTPTPVLDKDVSDIADGLGVSEETAQKIQEAAKELAVSKDTILVTDRTITSQKTDDDIKGAYFARIQARASKTTKKNIKLVWNKVKGADGYLVYGNRCNSKKWIYEYKLAKTITNKSKCSYIESKCKKGSYYKFIVRAYKNIDGKKVTIAVSKTIHVVTDGGKNGNAGSVKVNKGSVSLKKGKTFRIKAKETKQKKKLRYHRKVCYESSNPKVASVSKKGIIKAKKKGKCTIYAYAQNGIYKKVKVTVK